MECAAITCVALSAGFKLGIPVLQNKGAKCLATSVNYFLELHVLQ